MMRIKNYFFMAAAIASAMSVFSCAKVEDSTTVVKVEPITFGASFYKDEADRTVGNKTVIVPDVDADGNPVYKILWEKSDQIAVSGGTDPFVITPEIEEPSTSVNFYGEAAVADMYYAAYPYSALISWSGSTATMALPQIQSARLGSFASDLNISVSSTTAEEQNFQFHNVLGYLKFTIGEQSGQITDFAVSAIGKEKLSGRFAVDCSNAEPALVADAGANITVAVSSEQPLAQGDYYLAMFPGTYAQGLRFIVNGPDGIASKIIKPEGGLKLERGRVNTLGTIKVESWKELGESGFDVEFLEDYFAEDNFGGEGEDMEGFGPEDSFEFN